MKDYKTRVNVYQSPKIIHQIYRISTKNMHSRINVSKKKERRKEGKKERKEFFKKRTSLVVQQIIICLPITGSIPGPGGYHSHSR